MTPITQECDDRKYYNRLRFYLTKRRPSNYYNWRRKFVRKPLFKIVAGKMVEKPFVHFQIFPFGLFVIAFSFTLSDKRLLWNPYTHPLTYLRRPPLSVAVKINLNKMVAAGELCRIIQVLIFSYYFFLIRMIVIAFTEKTILFIFQ